ncbi:MAG: C25 family cysteine peptidase [Candidatus Zixiibacteriota bacterium]
MNRTLMSVAQLLTLLVFGSVVTVYGEANWISLEGNSLIETPSAEVLQSNQNETVIKFTISGFFSEDITENGVTYQKLQFPGYATTVDISKPELPVISELVGIPGNANVSVSIVDYKETTLPGYKVHPFQTPLLEGEKRVRFDIDEAFYRQNAFYPGAMASVGDPGIWRDLRVVSLKVNPLAFNPATGELNVRSEITVRLDYTGISDKNVKAPLRRPIATNYDRMYGSTVLNYGQMNLEVNDAYTTEPETDGVYDYLIIANDAFMDNMAPFVNWKNSNGLATTMVPISSIGANDALIKAYIANEYATNGIRYVLLVGDHADVPSHIVEAEGPGHFIDSSVSDYWYALLEGDDDYADLAIGRFSVTSATHVDNMVNKSMVFGSNPPGGDWLEKSLLVANWEDAPDKYQLCCEQIRTAAEIPFNNYSVLYPNFTTCYGASFANGGDEASNADVINYFNQGFRLINYRGHGDPESWQYWNVYGEYFRIAQAEAIDNGQLTPVVFAINCLNNDLLYSTATIGETFTRSDDAAVAYLGASDPSYTTPNHDYDKALYACVFDEGINALGDASNEASVRVIDLWGTYGVANAMMYLWLGDPSLQLIYDDGSVSCCRVPGDVDHSGEFDPLDITFFVKWVWQQGAEPPCLDEADADGDGEVSVLDLEYLINYIWKDGPAPAACP